MNRKPPSPSPRGREGLLCVWMSLTLCGCMPGCREKAHFPCCSSPSVGRAAARGELAVELAVQLAVESRGQQQQGPLSLRGAATCIEREQQAPAASRSTAPH
eukprot:7384476-Prymnesium_polylepis.2